MRLIPDQRGSPRTNPPLASSPRPDPRTAGDPRTEFPRQDPHPLRPRPVRRPRGLRHHPAPATPHRPGLSPRERGAPGPDRDPRPGPQPTVTTATRPPPRPPPPSTPYRPAPSTTARCGPSTHRPPSTCESTYDFSPGGAWYARARLGALRIPNCSASLVSPRGLVLTNHHCAREFVTQVSADGENLLDDGFYAATLADERPLEDFEADQLIEIVDVTDRDPRGGGRGERRTGCTAANCATASPRPWPSRIAGGAGRGGGGDRGRGGVALQRRPVFRVHLPPVPAREAGDGPGAATRLLRRRSRQLHLPPLLAGLCLPAPLRRQAGEPLRHRRTFRLERNRRSQCGGPHLHHREPGQHLAAPDRRRAGVPPRRGDAGAAGLSRLPDRGQSRITSRGARTSRASTRCATRSSASSTRRRRSRGCSGRAPRTRHVIARRGAAEAGLPQCARKPIPRSRRPTCRSSARWRSCSPGRPPWPPNSTPSPPSATPTTSPRSSCGRLPPSSTSARSSGRRLRRRSSVRSPTS